MSLLKRLRTARSQTPDSDLVVPTTAPTPILPTAQNAGGGGGVPVWMLGVVLVVVLVIVACAAFFVLSEPTPQEVVVVVLQPTVAQKPGAAKTTPVTPTPVSSAASSEDEGGILPVGSILVFGLLAVVVTAIAFLIYWSIYHPLLVVPVGQQYYLTDQRNGTVRVQQAGWTIVKKPIETVTGPFTTSIISLSIPQRVVLMKPAHASEESIQGEVRILLDLMVQFSITHLEILAKKAEGNTIQTKMQNLHSALVDIMVSLMEVTTHNYEVGQWEQLTAAFNNKAADPFSVYGVEIVAVRILNRDYADTRVKDAQAEAAIEMAKANAQRSAAEMDGEAIRHFLRAAGVKGPITAEQVALVKQISSGKGLLEGLLTSNMPAILQMFAPKAASTTAPTPSSPRLARVGSSRGGAMRDEVVASGGESAKDEEEDEENENENENEDEDEDDDEEEDEK